MLSLLVKQLPNSLQHIIRPGHGEGKFKHVGLEPMFPDRFLARIQAANENIVVPAIDGPVFDGLVRGFVAEVRRLPLVEEYFFGEPVGGGEIFS